MDECNKTELVNTDVGGGGTLEITQLDSLYLELGKAYYQGGFEDPLPQLLPLFDKIASALKNENRQAEPFLCPNCKTELPGHAKFCGVCGTSIGGRG